MKQHKVPALIFVLLMLLSATAAIIGPSTDTASAATTNDGFNYTFIDSNTVRITGYEGAGGNVVIPDKIEGRNVTTIDDAAFLGERDITSIVIPGSVTSIGARAFEQCTSLVSVVILGGVTTIEPSTFRGCTALAYVDLGSVTRIEKFAFYDTRALTSITIPSTVKTIESFAFWNNYNLVTIIFEEYDGYAPAIGAYWNLNHNSGLFAYLYPSNTDDFGSSMQGVTIRQLGTTATAPNNLTAAPDNGEVILSWSEPTYPGTSIDHYIVYVDGVEHGTTTDTTYSVTKLKNGEPLANGDIHSFYVRAHNGVAGGQDSNVIAALPLGVSIITPAVDGTYFTSKTGTIKWTIDASSEVAKTEVKIDDKPWTVVEGTSYDFNVTAEGEHIVQVKATDYLDHSETAQRTFIVDTIHPTVLSTKSPTGTNVTTYSPIVVPFSEAMNQASVTIDVDGIEGSMSWSGNTATFTPESRLKYDTKYTVTVSGTDLAGNPVDHMWQFTTMKDEGSVSGFIKDGDGDPVEGAVVKLNNSNSMTATTDKNGYFKLEHIPSGTYILSVVKDGYEYKEQYITVEAGNNTEIGTMTVKGTGGGSDWIIYVVVIVVAAVAIGLFVLVRRDRSGGSGGTDGTNGTGGTQT